MAKVVTTHMMLKGLPLLHVVGTRAEVLEAINDEATNGTGLGVDLVIAAKKDPYNKDAPYQRTRLFVGFTMIGNCIVFGEHTLEISDEPWGNEDDGSASVPAADAGGALVVEL